MTRIEKAKNAEDVLTLSEAARYLRVCRQTLARLIDGGEIPFTKVGRQYRIRKESLDKAMETR